MLTKSEIKELRDELKTSKKPVILFDDDADGLCSFLLFYHYMKDYCDDIKGIPMKEAPNSNNDIFARKIHEFNPDKVFILDRPLVHQDLIDAIKRPIIWLDHHPLVKRYNVKYFNPLMHKDKKYTPDSRPTTYWAWQIVKDERPQDIWIAMTGCVSDWFIPEFKSEFMKKYPGMIDRKLKIKNPGTLFHETRIGELARILNFTLKQSTKETLTVVKILTRIKDPFELLDQTTSQGRYVHKIYSQVNEVYESIRSRIVVAKDPLVYFIYEDNFAITGYLSNYIQYYNPDKVVLIARHKDDSYVCSIRSENIIISKILEKALVGIDGHGGGHEHACGAAIKKFDFERFLDNIRRELKNQKSSTK